MSWDGLQSVRESRTEVRATRFLCASDGASGQPAHGTAAYALPLRAHAWNLPPTPTQKHFATHPRSKFHKAGVSRNDATLSPSEQNAKPSAFRLTELCNNKSPSHARLKFPRAAKHLPARHSQQRVCQNRDRCAKTRGGILRFLLSNLVARTLVPGQTHQTGLDWGNCIDGKIAPFGLT